MEETLKIILDKLNSMDSDIKDIKSDIKDIKKDVKNLEKHALIIENRQSEDSRALYDGYKQTLENNVEIKNDIKDIKETLNIHEVKLLKVK